MKPTPVRAAVRCTNAPNCLKLSTEVKRSGFRISLASR